MRTTIFFRVVGFLGSAGGTGIKKKDSFKNHDPYRFTRSTAYPYK